jgi:hypothetical protein
MCDKEVGIGGVENDAPLLLVGVERPLASAAEYFLTAEDRDDGSLSHGCRVRWDGADGDAHQRGPFVRLSDWRLTFSVNLNRISRTAYNSEG